MKRSAKDPGFKLCSDVVVKRVDPETGDLLVVGIEEPYSPGELRKLTGTQRWNKDSRGL